MDPRNTREVEASHSNFSNRIEHQTATLCQIACTAYHLKVLFSVLAEA